MGKGCKKKIFHPVERLKKKKKKFPQIKTYLAYLRVKDIETQEGDKLCQM